MASSHKQAGTDSMTTNATYRRIIVPAQIGTSLFGIGGRQPALVVS